MHPVLRKTIGGLSGPVYGRHFFFGGCFLGFILFVGFNQGVLSAGGLLWYLLNTLLYPFARFAYESAVGFIFGKNMFVVNAVLLLIAKIMTMALCWFAAIFIAPLGLAYLYFHHSGKPG